MAMRGDPELREDDNLKDDEKTFVIPKVLFEGLTLVKHDILLDMAFLSKKVLEDIGTAVSK